MREPTEPGQVAVGIGGTAEEWLPTHAPEVAQGEHGADWLVLSAAGYRALSEALPTHRPARVQFETPVPGTLELSEGNRPGTMHVRANFARRGGRTALEADVRESWLRQVSGEAPSSAEAASRVVAALERLEGLRGQTTVRRPARGR